MLNAGRYIAVLFPLNLPFLLLLVDTQQTDEELPYPTVDTSACSPPTLTLWMPL